MTKHSQNISARIMQLAIDFIHSDECEKTHFTHYSEKHTGYAYPSLERRFKKDVGVRISIFIIAEKVKMAKKLIKDHPAIPLKQIAAKCRYKDLSHMTNHFKRMLNCTPSQYRKRLTETKDTQENPDEIMFIKIR